MLFGYSVRSALSCFAYLYHSLLHNFFLAFLHKFAILLLGVAVNAAFKLWLIALHTPILSYSSTSLHSAIFVFHFLHLSPFSVHSRIIPCFSPFLLFIAPFFHDIAPFSHINTHHKTYYLLFSLRTPFSSLLFVGFDFFYYFYFGYFYAFPWMILLSFLIFVFSLFVFVLRILSPLLSQILACL